MKKEFSEKTNVEEADFDKVDFDEVDDDMLPEYDFTKMSGGVRGKYYKAYRAGHTVKINKEDGTTSLQHFTLEDGAVMLEPDVRAYFPNSEAVNHALRCLIPLLAKQTPPPTPNTSS